MSWSLPRWQAAFPEHAGCLASLPNPIGRDDVIEACRSADQGPVQAICGFLAAMVWGYGRVGYGPYRTAVVLGENDEAGGRLAELAVRVRRDGGPEAFEWLAANRLRRLGVAFATKYLFFCGASAAGSPAPILDRLVRGWLARHADCHLRLDWSVADYRRYVGTLEAWAGELELAEADVEMLIFTLAVASNRTSQWAQPAGEWSITLASDVSPQTAVPDQVAVLEALDEAEEAFAALPASSDPEDADDFARGLRQLRRIVLARRAIDGDPAEPGACP